MPLFERFELERYFAAHEFSAKRLLCASDCETMTIGELLSLTGGSIDDLAGLRLGYTEPRGAPALRAAIAAGYDGIGPESILVHAGAEEAILNLCLATLEPGDRVVVNSPCYQSLREIPRALGCETVPWAFRESGGAAPRWFLDPDELPRLSGGKAKAIVLNAPHNPTGGLPTRAEFGAIVAYARETGALLLVDEVYRRLERDPAERLPSVCEAYENGIALDVLSKHSGLAGLRIGWLASRRLDLLDDVAQVKDYNSICASGPSEALATLAAARLDLLVARSRSIVFSNLALLEGFFARHGDFAAWTPPRGGSIAFPRLADGSDAEEMAARLLSATGTLLLPGAYYGHDPSYFRIGFGRADLPEALEALERWVEDGQPLA